MAFPADRAATDPRVRVLRDICLAADESAVLGVFRRKTTVALLVRLLDEPGEITHELLDSQGSLSATLAIRALLIENRLLPVRDEHLVRLEKWIAKNAELLPDPAEARAFVRFARWRHLRHLRNLSTMTTKSQASSRRRELKLILDLLTWSRNRGRSLSTLAQADLDRWRASGPDDRYVVKEFLAWAHRNRLCTRFEVEYVSQRELTVTGPSEEERWRLLARVFAATDADPGARLAAALIILYGARLSQLALLRLEDIRRADGVVLVLLGSEPLILPDELGDIVESVARTRTAARMFAPVNDTTWVFPGTQPGRPLSTDSLSDRVRKLGVSPRYTRSAALASLAQQLPAPIIARLIGLHPATAAKWAEAVSASQSNYAHLRLTDPVSGR